MSANNPQQRPKASTFIAGSFGNFVEWYDWGIFAVLAVVFAPQIFHAGSEFASLLQTLTTFAVGFAARPLGAVWLSPLGDRIGRKRLLALAILLMAAGSLTLAVVPNYAAIGILSPIIFVAARILQGISTGAEFQSAAGYIVEHAPAGRRGLYGSITLVTCLLGTLAATAMGALVTSSIPADALSSWGWRIPFLIGAILGLVGLYLRRRAPETPAFEQAAARDELVKSPLKDAFTNNKLTMLRIFAISIYTGSYYLWTAFLPTYAHLASGLPLSQTLVGGIISLIIMVIALPFYGHLSDKIGRKPLLITYCVAMVALAYPMLLLLQIPNFAVFLTVDIVGCLIIGLVSATQSTTYAELTVAESRTTVIGVPYNVSSALIGGTMPLIATSLLAAGHGPSVAFVVMGIAIFSGIVIAFMPEVRGRDITQTGAIRAIKLSKVGSDRI